MSQDKGRKYVTHTGRENVLAKAGDKANPR